MNYFRLEWLSTIRKIKENGYPLILMILLYILFFVFASYSIFKIFYFPQYIYIGGLLYILGVRVNLDKILFLRHLYGKKVSLIIRIIENSLITIPFALVLIYYGFFLEVMISFFFTVIVSFCTTGLFDKKIVPTPFYNFPFEFQIGYRKYFIVVIILYLVILLVTPEIKHEVGTVAFLGLFAIISTFYSSNIEDSTYLIINKRSPHQFLLGKLITSFFLTNLVVIPMLLLLIAFESFDINHVAYLYLSGLLFVILVILAKYSVFPKEISLSEGTIIAVSILILPIFLLTFPRFYLKAKRNLKQFLSDDHSRKSI